MGITSYRVGLNKLHKSTMMGRLTCINLYIVQGGPKLITQQYYAGPVNMY